MQFHLICSAPDFRIPSIPCSDVRYTHISSAAALQLRMRITYRINRSLNNNNKFAYSYSFLVEAKKSLINEYILVRAQSAAHTSTQRSLYVYIETPKKKGKLLGATCIKMIQRN